MSTITNMPSATGMPTLTSSTESFNTPTVTVPANHNNPYIIRQSNPTGTVFIAVGSIVGFILLGFILYHLIKSFMASRMTKRAMARNYEKYSGGSPLGLTLTGGNSSVAKMPLLVSQTSRSTLNAFMLPLGGGSNAGGSTAGGDTSTIYQSEYQGATSKHDLTKMFVSPTAEVMYHKRSKSSQYGNPLGVSGSSIFGGSTSNLGNPPVATNRHSTFVPSLYINNDVNNSDYSLANNSMTPAEANTPQARQTPTRSQRKTVPSMFLEDLIDE